VKGFRATGVGVAVFRDLRPSLPTIAAARTLGIPVIADLAEHFPGLVSAVRRSGLRSALVRRPEIAAALEREAARLADVVWVVCDENRERLVRYNPRTEVVGNFPSARELPAVGRPSSDPSAPVRVVSFGLINELRGLDLALEALKRARARDHNIYLDVYGDGPTVPALRRQAIALGLGDGVRFHGFVPPERRYEVMATGDVGVILHRPNELTHHTVPNKLFDYMALGLPVVSTPLRPVLRIVSEARCGLVVAPDPDEVAAALVSLARDVDLRRALGAAGREAVLREFLWEAQAPRVVATVGGLLRREAMR